MKQTNALQRAFVPVLVVMFLVLMVVGVNQVEAASNYTVTFSQSGGTSTTYYRDPSFSLEKSASWITISTSSPSAFTIKASSNSTGKGRIGYVYVKRQGSVVTTYTIIQPGSTNLSVGIAKGSTSTYGKNSNQSISVSGNWITIYRPNDYNFRIDYSANTTGSTRTGYVYVKEGSTIFTTYKITQSSSVTVTYDKNGGSGSNYTRSIAYGSNYGKVDNPTRTGYNFAGWFTAKSGGSQVTETTKMQQTANHTLYARWSPKTFTVSFNSQGGSTVSSKTVIYDGTYGTLVNPQKTGYTFTGWYTAASGGSQVTASTKVKITANQVLYAHWAANTYTVTFKDGDTTVSTTTVTYGSTYGTLPTRTKTGYENAKWYTATSGGSQITASTKVTITANQTLYARWTAEKYTVTFKDGSTTVSTATVTYGSTYGTLPTRTKTGYENAKWYTATSGGSQITASTKVTITGNQTLYARWTAEKYAVTFKDGDTTVSTTTVTYGSTYGTVPTRTKIGYTFLGWYTATSGGSKVTESTTVSRTGNHTLYARWSANTYTVTFKDGNTKVSTATVTYGSTYGTLPTRSKTGYTFEGWYTEKTAGSKKTSTTTVTTPTDHTLYAHWTAESFTVTYDKNGGNGSNFIRSIAYGSTYGKASDNPTRDGYRFTGWWTAKIGGRQVTETTSMSTAGNHTLYAHWTLIEEFTIKYHDQDGNLIYSDTFEMGTPVRFRDKKDHLVAVLKNPGGEIDGWSVLWDKEKLDYEFGKSYTIDSDISVYPHWKSVSTCVTYSLGNGYITDRVDGCGVYQENFEIYYHNTEDKLCSQIPSCYTAGEEFVGWAFSDDYDRVYTSSNSVKDVLNHIGAEYNDCFTLRAVYMKKGTWKISEIGGVWYNKAGDMAINLKGKKAKEFIEYVYSFINDHREQREQAEDAEWNFWLTVATAIIPTGIDDFIVNWAQNGFVNAFWESGKEATDWSYQEILELSKEHKTTMDIWGGWSSFCDCAMALIETGELHTDHLQEIYDVFDRLEVLYGLFEENKMFDSDGEALSSDYWILIFDGAVFVRAEGNGNLMIVPPGKDPKDGKWMEPEHFNSRAIEAILLQKPYFFSDFDR